MLSQHSLLDWGQFDSQGSELVRRWYKKGWTESPDKLVDQIFAKLHDAIQENVDSTAKFSRKRLQRLNEQLTYPLGNDKRS